jgi:hypothetical protein
MPKLVRKVKAQTEMKATCFFRFGQFSGRLGRWVMGMGRGREMSLSSKRCFCAVGLFLPFCLVREGCVVAFW